MARMAQDPHLWLEDIDSDEALDWVRRRNAACIAEFSDPEFERMRAEALEVLDTDTRIPLCPPARGVFYNFWRDADNLGVFGDAPASTATAPPPRLGGDHRRRCPGPSRW